MIIFAGVTGNSLISIPRASETALTIAGATGISPGSPIPFARRVLWDHCSQLKQLKLRVFPGAIYFIIQKIVIYYTTLVIDYLLFR